ncbi:hypothetical protein [Mucilaginibacter sp.]|jgi:hypothetical protein|uniref:hypothetical protein n=1 Tax=Mucilaginibacter sp. TaxID=1882438 RepID=UPI002C9C9E52|nr:hypothetical protein [Mucilaginibacter sp.]HTI60222.1 hypothetical protein [Mucilaginibacter sp.]
MRYFKQYGCKRTGTNYLRALLQQNFEDVIVLMHTLGGKHEYPVDLQKYLEEYHNDPEGFVIAATSAHPAETSLPFSAEQTAFMKVHAAGLSNAVSNHQIHYLVSIKNPYAWINSNKDPESWVNNNYRDILLANGAYSHKARINLLIKLKSREFNSLYSSYFDLSKQFPAQTTIVRYEDILADTAGFLSGLSQRLRLKSSRPFFVDIKGSTVPTVWDQEFTADKNNDEFTRDYYLKENYLNDLSSDIITILEAEIDWDLMKNYGYYKLN